MSTPNPALVSQRAAARLPRIALLLFCAAYVLPGVFGRDPWKNADVTAVGYMMGLVRGDASWLTPAIAGIPGNNGVLPYWIGAAFIHLLSPAVDPALAARVPFALLLASVLACVWYATFHLARTEAAQPVPFAFGGEASPVDYARAIADGAVLALIASLGLLQLGHETTPELLQLAAIGLFLYALAAAPRRIVASRACIALSLPVLAVSGAATTAVLLAAAGSIVCFRSSFEAVRRFGIWVLGAGLLAAGLATALGAWVWRVNAPDSPTAMATLLVWFTWPVWPLVLWTLWRWRQYLLHRHIAIPLTSALVSLLVSLFMGASDRALLLALPGLSILAAFALPTLLRSVSSAIDWFSVFFFTIAAIVIWVVYLSMQTGIPAKPAANVARLAPGFVSHFDLSACLAAVLATLAWLWLVRWRAGRQRHPLWKSMVLPAGGVALCWLLLMTLWLPPLNYARSYASLIDKMKRVVPAEGCIQAEGLTTAQLAALEVMGGWRVNARPAATRCAWLVMQAHVRKPEPEAGAGWERVARMSRATDADDGLIVFRRR